MALIIRRTTWVCTFGAVALWSLDASAGLQMRTDCQKNRADGHIIADLGGRSPNEVAVKVLSFEPRSTGEAGTWSFGRCLIEITQHGSMRR